MLPKNHKVGTNPIFNGPQKSTAAKAGAAVSGAAKVAGGAIAKAAVSAGGAVGSAAKAAAGGVGAAASRGAQMARHPVISAKGGAAQVKNSYTTALNDPRRSGVGSTVASNVKNRPVMGTVKTAAAVTGALAPAAFVKGAVNPGDAFRTRQALKQDKADKKMGGLSWTPPRTGAAPPGARPRPGA